MGGDRETREFSYAVFNNEKWSEVVLALESLGGTPISQEIARRMGVTSDLVTAVLRRLEDAQLVKALPRIGNPSRGTLPWEVQRGPRWDAMVSLCRSFEST
jgi:MarR family